MDYETGVIFAFFTWIYGLTMMVVNVNSQMNKNLQKVGLRMSWLNFTPTPMEGDDQNKPLWRHALKFILIAGIGIPFIFLSWIQVVIYVGTVLYKLNKDSGAPQSVKDFRWKMRNVDMPMNQVIQELMLVEGVEPSSFEEYKTNLIDGMKERGLIIRTF